MASMGYPTVSFNFGQPVMTTKVHIQNIPPDHEFRNKLQDCLKCRVELYHADGVATFWQPIGINFYNTIPVKKVTWHDANHLQI